jgi:hypothetical protein
VIREKLCYEETHLEKSFALKVRKLFGKGQENDQWVLGSPGEEGRLGIDRCQQKGQEQAFKQCSETSS